MAQSRTAAEDLQLRTAPVLTPVTRLELVSRANPDDVREVLDTSDRSYDPERTGLVDGSVSVNVQGDSLRSLSLSLVDWTGDWFPGAGRSLWLDAMVKVYRGYTTTQLWPQGVFLPIDPEQSDRRHVQFSGVDKSGRANGRDEGGFTTILSLAKGLNLKTALQNLAAYPTWNETLLNLADTDKGLPYSLDYGLTDYPWKSFTDVANFPGDFRRWYDERGYLTWVQDPDPNLLSTVWEVWPDGSRPGTALPGEFAYYASASKRVDASKLKNWIGVRGGGAKSAPVYAEAVDTDPNSPTAVSRIGYRMFWWNGGQPDPLITTQADAQARADYELRRQKQWTERVPLRIMELPILQPWDVLRVTNPDAGLGDTYQIVSYTLPLAGSTEMQLEGWRVRKAVG